MFRWNPNGESNRQVAPENADIDRNRTSGLGSRLLAACCMGDTWA